MCFNAVDAEMNLSVPVIQPGLLWNPVWGIFIRSSHASELEVSHKQSALITVQMGNGNFQNSFLSILVCLVFVMY